MSDPPQRPEAPQPTEGGDRLDELTSVLENKVGTEAAPAVREETPVEVNERGFMTDLSQWTPEAALFLARRQGIPKWPLELTSDHWRVVYYMRAYYHATGNAPSLRYTCKALGMTKKRFTRLFPGGLMTVRRISGLPGTRRSANKQESSIAQQALTRNWWERLTSVELRDNGSGRISRLVSRLAPRRRGAGS
jgi:TusE/DsrC/DsvC family sulfur relay protein